MSYHTEQIERLSEAQFRNEILLPLLRAMGYRSVEDHHGKNEIGKDIVCYRTREDGHREYMAFVVKKGPIRASVSAVQPIATQINQAYHTKFPDKVSGEKFRIHEVIVVASGKISPDARSRITPLINTVEKHVSYWDGNKVCELLARNGIELPFVEQLLDIRSHITRLRSFDVQITVSNEKSLTEVKPRVADIQPIRASFRFPNTNKGNQVARQFQKHVEEGHDVTIPGEFIQTFELHEELSSLFGTAKPPYLSLRKGDTRKLIPLRLLAESVPGEKVTYDSLRLKCWKSGTKRAEFRSDDRGDALLLKLVILENKQVELQIGFQVCDCLVHKALKAARLWGALSNGASLEIRNAETFQRLWRIENLEGVSRPHDDIVQYLERLAEIQEYFGVVLKVPSPVVKRDIMDAFELLQVIRTGKFVLPPGTVTLSLKDPNIELMDVAFKPQTPRQIALQYENVRYRICGEDLDLGPVTRTIDSVAVSAKDYHTFRRKITKNDSLHPLVFRPTPECKGVVDYYPDHLSAEVRNEYEIMFASRVPHSVTAAKRNAGS